jgi:hypothetical protein
MYDVVVYLSSLPRIADRNRKVEVLRAFAEGAQQRGAKVLVQTANQVVDCKIAVILGWVGAKISGPHIQLRKDVIARQSKTGNHIMPIDSSCFKFIDHNSEFLRYSLGGVFYNKNNYANTHSNSTKWAQIQNRFGLNLKPWRDNGNHVLVCLQRDGGWSLKGTDMTQWANQTVNRLRKLTSRPIVIRSHPKHPMNLSSLTSLPNVRESKDTTLIQDLSGAWASVFYNSSSCVASILEGIPVFATDDDCVAWNIANHDITQIENPSMPDREQWLYDLCSCHWTDSESQRGDIYQKFLECLQ